MQRIVWVEGDVYSASKCSKLEWLWRIYGPEAIINGIKGRRMCYVIPANQDENPIFVARMCEKIKGRF